MAMLTTMDSCQKMDSKEETVSVYLTYTITTDNGQDMPGTKASSADVFDEFYQKIKSGELVAPNYNFTFTEKTTGAVYTVDGIWAGKDMVTLRTGTYKVVGTSTAFGENIQDKCSLKFEDEITVDVSSKTITLKAKYDCSLIIFSDASIAKLSNFNGISSTDLFKFNNYIYAFIHTKLYADGKQAEAYLEGSHANETQFKIYTGNLNYEIGKFYVYNDINAAFDLEKMEEGGDEGFPINLSKGGTANCYIATSNGSYKFKATVKGNSTMALDGIAASASTVWETLNSSTSVQEGDLIQNVTFSGDYICFSTTANTGNALIAVMDVSGTILWSWHIWVTDYIPENEYDEYTGHSGIKVMNRNLGAMSSIPGLDAIGLIYEWGRKDPFMGSSSLTSYEAFKSTANFPADVESTAQIGTDSYAVNNPTQYIYSVWQGGDWRYVSDNSAWSSSKSINDPCPRGWKIPDGGPTGVFSNFPSSYSDGCKWDSTNRGLSLDSSFGSNAMFFPAQGYHVDCFSGYYWEVGDEGRYWTTYTNDNRSDYISFTDTYINPFHTTSSFHLGRANGLSVRCCSE